MYTNMLKAYKYRIYPSETQKQHFVQAMGCARYIYNKGLELKIQHYEQTGKSLSYFDMNSPNGMLIKAKQEHDWLSFPYSQSLQMSLRNLDNAFQRFFKKKSGFPKFKSKHDKQSLQYPQRVWVDFKRSKIKIPKAGEVLCVFDRKFEGKIKTCTVSRTPTDKFYVSIMVDNDQPLPNKQAINELDSIGIDLGLKHFATLSDGAKIDNPKYLSKLLARLKVLQRRASKKVLGSNNRRKANLKVARLHEVISNQRNDFLHKLSSKIISENQTIILEDLNVAGMLKNHKLAQSISDVSWSKFIVFLKYKAEWYGKNIIQIGQFEPSSKLCSDCGWKNTNLSLKDREWHCPECNSYHDRDTNAAINIKKFGLIQSKSGSGRPAELVEMSSSTHIREDKSKKNRRNKKPFSKEKVSS
jgi:putative transposase